MCPNPRVPADHSVSRKIWPLVGPGLLIAGLTLHPHPESHLPRHAWGVCLFCGDLGGIDFLLNIALFTPLGLAWRWTGRSGRGILLGAFGFSLAIEVTQFTLLPGRFAGFGDLVANTAGGGLGWLLQGHWRDLLVPTVKNARRMVTAWGGALVLLFIGTGWMLQPSLPRTIWYGQWRADLGAYDQFTGTVTEATLGERPMPGRRLTDTPERRGELLGRPLRLAAAGATGSLTKRIAPIVSVYDNRESQIALLGQSGADLLVSFRTVGTDWGFRHPMLLLQGGLGSEEGFPYRVTGLRLPGSLEGEATVGGRTRRATQRLSLATGWLLFYPFRVPTGRWALAADLAWLLLLTLVLGYYGGSAWGRTDRWLLLGLGLGLAVSAQVISQLWYLATLTPVDWVALGAGLAAGWGLGGGRQPAGRP